MLTQQEVLQLDGQYVAHTYARYAVPLKQGSGAQCQDFDGKNYIDFGSGIGVNSLGFCNQAWADAVSEQAHTLNHCSNYFATEPCVLLAQEVCRRTGMSKVFFANSGAEANEGAIKVARKYASQKGKPGGVIVTLVNSFHGRTMTTLTATGQENMHVDFAPFMPGFVYAKAGDLADTLQKLDGAVAVMMEMIQGEGGVNMLDKDYVAAVADYCHEHDILIIDDEVQAGAGRTGTFLCCEHFGLKPDIVTMAKGLGGGLPIGAVVLSEKVQAVFSPGSHGSTFGGNPIVCAGALAVLGQMDDAFLQSVTHKGEKMKKALLGMPGVTQVSGCGLMLGISLEKAEAKAVVAKCLEKGLIVLTAKEKVRLLPPLNITEQQIDAGLAILQQTLAEMA